MPLSVQGIASDHAHHLRSGGLDANGQPAEVRVAEGLANPCRHCLQLIAPGDEMLVLAYRPFDRLQPYAEIGPIFLHRRDCDRYDRSELPPWFRFLEPALVRGYGNGDRILYETGDVVPGPAIEAACGRILKSPLVDYVHVRSKYNCFQCRVDRV